MRTSKLLPWCLLIGVLLALGCPDGADDDVADDDAADDDASDDDVVDDDAVDDDVTDDDVDDDDTSDDDSAVDHDDDLGYACDVTFPVLPSPPSIGRSFHALPTSNGYVSATYAIDLYGVPVTYAGGYPGVADIQHRLHTFTDHVMAQPTPTEFTRDLLFDLFLGVRLDGAGTWLSDVAESEAAYVPGTGIVRLVQQVGDVEVETFAFAPMHGESYALVLIGHATNQGAGDVAVDLYSLHNFHAGGEGVADGESVTQSGDETVIESRVWDHLCHRSLGPPTHRSAAPGGDADHNPWMLLTAGSDLSDQLISGDDVAVGFQWSLGTLGPGADGWAGLVVGLNGNGEDAAALASRVDGFVAGRGAADVLAGEQAFWDDYHAAETMPSGLSADEEAVFRQSTAVLKMGQVREPGSGYGQILASLPPGGWNISWPRDAAYAIVAQAHAGHHDEARDALQFMIDGDAGHYASYLGISDYLISACRYYGDGTEESDGATCADGTDAGPNVELDDFGLFLWAYGEYVDASGDTDFLNDTLDAVLDGVADPLVALIDEELDLLVADSSIWERHWDECFPNGAKHFSYSDVLAVHGLRVAQQLSGNPVYDEAAERIRSGLLNMSGGPVFEESFDGEACPVLASSPEEVCAYCGPYDASVIESVNLGIYRPDSSMAKGTMRALQQHLAMSNGSPGFLRNDDGSGTTNPHPWYDDQEWVVIDLRMAAAMAEMGDALGDATLTSNAETLVDWVTLQARANADLIGELLSDGVYQADDDYDHSNLGADDGYEIQGSAPMCGFGPGAYILALEALH